MREIRNAINDAPSGKSVIITLGNDITLTGSTLDIPAGKDITLTSNKASGYYKIVGASGKSTVTVEGGGLLNLELMEQTMMIMSIY